MLLPHRRCVFKKEKTKKKFFFQTAVKRTHFFKVTEVIFKWSQGASRIISHWIPLMRIALKKSTEADQKLLGSNFSRVGFYLDDSIDSTEMILFCSELHEMFMSNPVKTGTPRLQHLFYNTVAVYIIIHAFVVVEPVGYQVFFFPFFKFFINFF